MTQTARRTRTAAELLSLGAAAVLLLAAPLAAPAAAAGAPVDRADSVEVYERDVFVIVGVTLRNPDSDTDPGEVLFNRAGVRLQTGPDDPITWGEWSAATARSEATVEQSFRGTTTSVVLRMTGLVPNGRYSVFWGTLGPDSEQRRCPGVERTLPLDGTTAWEPHRPAPNTFVADTSGNAWYFGSERGDLFAASQLYFSIVFDWSGETSYPFPNRGELRTQGSECHSSFGDDTMRHLLVLQKW